MSDTIINIKNSGGVILDTYHRYCDGNIQVKPVLQSKSVTENGSVVADEGYCGLSSVVIDVPTGIDISDTTAVAADVRQNRDFYLANGVKTAGTISDYDGSITGNADQVGLNIHYGDTAPEDTSKLWVNTQTAKSVEISPDLYGETI